MILIMSLGKRIQGARLAAGYEKPVELATITGISKQTISNYERDKVTKPDPNTLALIASATGVSLMWIVTGTGNPKSNDLSIKEQELLKAFKELQESDQKQLADFIKFLLSK